MIRLNLPDFTFRIREQNNRSEIFDPVRRIFVALTPEEWVRQNFIQFLVQEKNIPLSLIGVEKAHTLYKMKRRSDILIFGDRGLPVMVVECKAPTVKISQKSFDQVARYNMILKVKYLVVTNGLQHFCSLIDYEQASYSFLEEIPDYSVLKIQLKE
jgi:type I site-specific restriction endonuclease